MAHQHRSHLMLLLLALVTALAGQQGAKAYTATSAKDNSRQNHYGAKQHRERPQANLLVVVIGGFRWDYLERFAPRGGRFPGFDNFRRGGVETEYLQSVFPSESFPAWQTINTGLYPGDHNIIANQFADVGASDGKMYFDRANEHYTGLHKWWNANEPIWASASKAGLNFSTFLWSRCDVEWFDVKTEEPKFCENIYKKDESKTLQINIEMAQIHFQEKMANAAIVYEDSLLKASAQYGPLSKETESSLRQLDAMINYTLGRLAETHMDEHVNFIIMSDHGMSYGANPTKNHHPFPNFPFNENKVRTVSMEAAIRPVGRQVRMVVGEGAYAMVFPVSPEATNRVLRALDLALKGVEIYTEDQIPPHLHWKDSKYCPPILVLAHPGTVIQRASGQHQRPPTVMPKSYDEYEGKSRHSGISGYDPEEPEMRGVFMARGPGFLSSDYPQPPIHLVDIYQMICFLLDIDPLPNDGIWDRIRALLKNSSVSLNSSVVLTLFTLLFVTLQ